MFNIYRMLFLALKKESVVQNHSQSDSHYLIKSRPGQNFSFSLLGEFSYPLMLFGKPCLSIHEKLDSLKVFTLGRNSYSPFSITKFKFQTQLNIQLSRFPATCLW